MSDRSTILKEIKEAIPRIEAQLIAAEHAFLVHVGSIDITAKRKAKGYHDGIIELEMFLSRAIMLQKKHGPIPAAADVKKAPVAAPEAPTPPAAK